MLRPIFASALALALLTAPSFAQDTLATPVRSELSRLLKESGAPFAIGPGIDGDITLSADTLSLADRIKLILSMLPYRTSYTVENGIHIVRRVADIAATPTGPTIHVAPPGVSVAAPHVTNRTFSVASYTDALKLEIALLQAERAAAMAPGTANIDRAQLTRIDQKIRVLNGLLARPSSPATPTVPAEVVAAQDELLQRLKEAQQKYQSTKPLPKR